MEEGETLEGESGPRRHSHPPLPPGSPSLHRVSEGASFVRRGE